MPSSQGTPRSLSLKDSLDHILDACTAKGGDTKGKLLGSSFIALDKDGN